MNTTATKKFALATLTAPALAALAISLAGAASAESPSAGSAQQTVEQFQDQGYGSPAKVAKCPRKYACEVRDARPVLLHGVLFPKRVDLGGIDRHRDTHQG
jgi:hypothetical protein